MPSKQENYLMMHHPSIYKGMKKGGKVEDYKKGGKVACYAKGGYNTDTVPAMLTPGEVVLNADQQEALGNMMAGGGKAGGGQARAAALFKHIGVPGYQEGRKVSYAGDEIYKTEQTDTGGFKTTGRYKMNTPEGERWYESTGESRDLQLSRDKSTFDVLFKAANNPADSLVTGGVRPAFEQPKLTEETKKKGLFGSLFKAGGGLVDKKDALTKYYMGGRVKKKKKKQKRGY